MATLSSAKNSSLSSRKPLFIGAAAPALAVVVILLQVSCFRGVSAAHILAGVIGVAALVGPINWHKRSAHRRRHQSFGAASAIWHCNKK